jgi:hypothetical protein
MKKDQRTARAYEPIPRANDTPVASTTESQKRKLPMGFLYLFVALARRASEDKSVQELQNLSGLIESEIQELQKDKSKLRVRDVFRRK